MLLSRSTFPALLLCLIYLYLYLYHISTFHSHLTSFLLWHLLLLTFKEDGGRNLLNYDLQCSGHFLINAVDKAVFYYLMRMQQATLDQKLPYCPLTSTLFRFQLPLKILQNTLIHFFPSSSGFLPQAQGLQHSYTNAATLQLHSRSLSSHKFFLRVYSIYFFNGKNQRI